MKSSIIPIVVGRANERLLGRPGQSMLKGNCQIDSWNWPRPRVHYTQKRNAMRDITKILSTVSHWTKLSISVCHGQKLNILNLKILQYKALIPQLMVKLLHQGSSLKLMEQYVGTAFLLNVIYQILSGLRNHLGGKYVKCVSFLLSMFTSLLVFTGLIWQSMYPFLS